MKKRRGCFGVLSFLLILSVSVCSSIYAAPVEPLKAKKVAQNLLVEKSKDYAAFISPAIIAAEKIDNQPVYYIINFPKGGWAIISADDIAHPVIAFSYTGSYSPDTPKSPEFESWMKNVGEEIYDAVRKKISPLPKTGTEWNRLNVDTAAFRPGSELPLDNAVAPLVTTTWNQGKYYNELCPLDTAGPDGQALTGCLATAMAQVMKYHNYPTTGAGNHSYAHPTYETLSVDFASTTYDWASMPSSLSAYNTATATLMYHAGVSVDMNYGPSSSGANTGVDAVNALKSYFAYSESTHYEYKSSYTVEEWLALLRNELDDSRPVLYRGSGAQGGHAFVCDGYAAGGSDNNDYFHFNWGWSGSNDGYFYLDDLTPGGFDFTSDQGGIFGIAPVADSSLNYPYVQEFESGVPSEWIINGYRAALSGNEFHSGATSVLLGSSEETSYYNEGNSILYINVPVSGATLSFWVKRGYSPASSLWNQQVARLETKYGKSVLHTFYDGDFSDAAWQQFSLDLTPWAGSTVKLFIQQYNSSGSYYQWTYVDDILIIVPGIAPTVTTQAVTGIDSTTATGNGNITDLGTPNPTQHGVCWNTNGSPDTDDICTEEGAASATGVFTSSMTGLSPNTTYYVRAYATSTADTSYGGQVIFTTNLIAPSTVTTQEITGIGSTTATGNGNITDLGTPNPTQHGVCWNTNGSPDTDDICTEEGAASVTGVFTSSMTGLSPNTTYYVRAYATNTADTSYGGQISFTTISIAPTVTTQAVTGIGSTTATGNGNITGLGAPEPTQHGVCWNTTGSPDTGDKCTEEGAASAPGAFTSSLAELSPNMTYYVRAYVTNMAGTVYGDEVSFTSVAVWFLSILTEGSGTVTSTPAGIDCGVDCDESYEDSLSVTLTATPEPNFKFTGWAGDADCEDGMVTITADVSCRAIFYRFPWPIFMPAITVRTLQQ